MNKLQMEKIPDILSRIGAAADKQGFKVYLVGGYVRDYFLDRDSDARDLDFSVEGDAIAFSRCLKKAIDARNPVVYERFGTAMLEAGNYKLEFVTAREESYEKHSRKPEIRIADLKSDLSRRDFTINAIAVGLNDDNWLQIYDPFDGRLDLDSGVIRTPGDPAVTFDDDPLRMLRAIRFAAQFQFDLDDSTAKAIQEMAPRMKIVSRERISDELFKILALRKPSSGFLQLDQHNLLPEVFPELVAMKGVEQRKGYHHKDVFLHTLRVADNVASVSEKPDLRLAALMHDVAKPRTKRFDEDVGWTFHGHDEIGARMMEKIAGRMRISKEMKEYVQKLIRLHLRPIFLSSEEVTDSAIRRLIVQAGEDLDDLLKLCRADITSGNPKRVRQHLRNFDYVMERVREVNEKDELRHFQSPVRGEKIMSVCNIPPGPLVGRLKKAIEEAILDGLIPNEYGAAMSYLLQIKDEYLQQVDSPASISR